VSINLIAEDQDGRLATNRIHQVGAIPSSARLFPNPNRVAFAMGFFGVAHGLGPINGFS